MTHIICSYQALYPLKVSRGECSMASDLDFVEYVVDQMEGAGPVSYKKMFGEYAIYRQGKVVALICDNQLRNNFV